jgi:hypothetical protein
MQAICGHKCSILAAVNFPSSLLIELACLVAAVLWTGKEKAWPWKGFVPFMLFICLVEGTGWIMSVLRIFNHWVYNIELPVEFFFTGAVLYSFLSAQRRVKGWWLAAAALFSIVFVAELLHNRFVAYTDMADELAAILFILASGVYFYFLLRSPDYVDLKTSPAFWIVAGIFLFYFGATAVTVFFDQLMSINLLQGIPLRYLIFTVLNAILYGCWAYGLRCRYLQQISFSR